VRASVGGWVCLSEGFRTVIVSDATESPGLARDHGLAPRAILGAELVSARGLYYEWVRTVAELNKIESGTRIMPPAGTLLLEGPTFSARCAARCRRRRVSTPLPCN